MKFSRQLSFLLAALLLTGCGPAIDGRESFGDKREWSILQAREYQARTTVVSAPSFTSSDEYVLLVVPDSHGAKNVWIMLTPRHPPFYKQMPRGNYTISQSLFELISHKHLASSTVEEVLASHVAK
jgi:hypothetical protein